MLVKIYCKKITLFEFKFYDDVIVHCKSSSTECYSGRKVVIASDSQCTFLANRLCPLLRSAQ